MNYNIISQYSTISNNYKNKLGHYLAGLIESDDTIIVPYGNNIPTIKIVFHIKDLPLVLKIKEVLDFCSIQKTSSDLAVELVFRGKKDLFI